MDNKNQSTSIYDLFLVLVKYRKLILIGTLCSIIFSVIFFVIKPKSMEKKKTEAIDDSEKVLITYTVKENLMPYDLRNAVLENDEGDSKIIIQDLCVDYINRETYIAAVNKKFPLYGKYSSLVGENKDSFQYNSYIKKLWDKDKNGNKRISVRRESFNNGFYITMLIKRCDIPLSKDFMTYIVNDTEANLESYILPKINDYIKTTERRIQIGEKLIETDKTAYAVLQDKDLVAKAKEYLENFDSFIYLEEDAFGLTVDEKKVNYNKKAVILVLGVFFVLIVVAFILNAISNLKKDPEASGAFKSAWEAGKFSKK